jgi:PKD repeat protein
LCITTYSIEAVDVSITDDTGDVFSLDFLTGEWTVITDHPDIEVDNLDLIQATYTQTGTQATVSLQVNGNIENRGEFLDPYNPIMDINMAEYDFQLITSRQGYSLSYCNKTGRLSFDDQQINLTSSDFSVVGNTLTMTFTLTSADEIYENLSIFSVYLKANLSETEPVIVYLVDIAPTPPLWIDAYASYNGYKGENIQFYGYIEPLSGHPPYTRYWDFGDGSSSTELEPTHTYTEAGVYTYTFTVTDTVGVTASVSYNITIYDVKKAFLFGRFTNMSEQGDLITVESVDLKMILLKPFQYLHYTSGQNLLFLNEYKGIIISNKLLVGLFYVIIIPGSITNIAHITDAPVNNTATRLLQRFLPENIFNILDCY